MFLMCVDSLTRLDKYLLWNPQQGFFDLFTEMKNKDKMLAQYKICKELVEPIGK